MKKYLLASLFLIGALFLEGVPGFAVYEQPITFSEVSYYATDGTTPIEGPQAGGFIVSATATYNGSDSRTTRLLCAFVNQTTGAILQIAGSDAASWPGDATQTLKAEMTLESIAGCDFKCYFIDDLGRHTPLANQAPGAPGAILSSNVTGNSVDLSWDAADDDFQNITGYEIYKNGAKVATCTDTEITLSNLMRNTPVNLSVLSSDGQLVSEAATTTVSPKPFPEVRLDSANKGSTLIESDYISFYHCTTSAGLVTDAGVVAGMPSYMFAAAKYPSFFVNTDYFSESDREAMLEVTYLDQWSAGKTSSTPIYIQAQRTSSSDPSKTELGTAYIDDPQNPGTVIPNSSRPFTVTNTGVWKTEVRKLVNFKFTAAGVLDGGYDKHLRLYTTGGASDVYLAKVSLTKPEDYSPMNPNMVVEGGMIVYGINFTLPGGCDVAYALTEKDGVTCAASTDAGSLAYKLTDAAVSAAAAVKLEVTFYDGHAGDTLHIGGQTVAMDGSGWRTVVVDTTGAELSAGFAFSTQSGGTVYLKSLQAYEV
ncbi:MAG: fibronectin type III domain-containing protein [Clostridia bacterium]